MVASGRNNLRSSLRRVIGTGLATGALLAGGVGLASADPAEIAPPNCTAADLAVASGTVGTAMGDYLFSHPWVNDFFTGLRGLPNEQIRGEVQTYMDANPQTEAEINAIRQPITDLRARCDVTADPTEGG